MASICMYFQVHQPLRLRKVSLLSMYSGQMPSSPKDAYFNRELNEQIFRKVASKCYLPTNELLLQMIDGHNGDFRFSFSLTGVFLEQCEMFGKDVLDSFKRLADTGKVDFLAETYYHSLSSFYRDGAEFDSQVRMHHEAIRSLLGVAPSVFRNTESIFSNDIAARAERLGYSGIIAEGIEHTLGWRSPNYVYGVQGCEKIKVLMRNYNLSDDIGYRFSSRTWKEWPLTAEKYAGWLAKCDGQCVNIFMDFETFGEHHWSDTGIFSFLKSLPGACLAHKNLNFRMAREVAGWDARGTMDVPYPTSWADMERDLSAWLGNDMQHACFSEMESLGEAARRQGGESLEAWRLLQSSDHLYYLCTKSLSDGDVHKYFSHYANPYEGFINYMNIIQDFKARLGGV
ncbi:MAG: glycoside hydrolase family 57 protein [Candidatus Micrarchaeia archaeon]|jgi:alpha-amylase